MSLLGVVFALLGVDYALLCVGVGGNLYVHPPPGFEIRATTLRVMIFTNHILVLLWTVGLKPTLTGGMHRV